MCSLRHFSCVIRNPYTLSLSLSLRYELHSIIIRSGGNPSDASASVASVHYYAYARDTEAADGTWLRLDDGRVAKGIVESTVLEEAYGGKGLQKFATFVAFQRAGGGRGDAEGAAERMRMAAARTLREELAAYERRVANELDRAEPGEKQLVTKAVQWASLVDDVTEAKLVEKGYVSAAAAKSAAEQLAERAKEFGMTYTEFRAQVLSACVDAMV